jgi:hypothetical protein
VLSEVVKLIEASQDHNLRHAKFQEKRGLRDGIIVFCNSAGI